MSVYAEIVLFILILALNLFLLGTIITGGIVLSFKFIENISPRRRYTMAVAGFLTVIIIPLLLTINSSFSQKSLFETVVGTKQILIIEDSFEKDNVLDQQQVSSDSTKAPQIVFGDLPNSFVLQLAGSSVGSIFLCFWTAGSFYLLRRELIAHRLLAKARKNWRAATNSERKELLCPPNIPLFFDDRETPGTVGFFSSQIILPESFGELSIEAKHYIFQHELAHAGWRDPLINSIVRILRAIFWISPALWLIERYIKNERESAADFAAIHKFSTTGSEFKGAALEFASVLFSAAKQFNSLATHERTNPLLMRLGGQSGSELENRIQRFLNYSPRINHFRRALAAMIFILSLTGMLIVCLASQPINSIFAQTKPEESEFLSLMNAGKETSRDLKLTKPADNYESPHITGGEKKPEQVSLLNLNSTKFKSNTSISEKVPFRSVSSIPDKSGIDEGSANQETSQKKSQKLDSPGSLSGKLRTPLPPLKENLGSLKSLSEGSGKLQN